MRDGEGGRLFKLAKLMSLSFFTIETDSRNMSCMVCYVNNAPFQIVWIAHNPLKFKAQTVHLLFFLLMTACLVFCTYTCPCVAPIPHHDNIMGQVWRYENRSFDTWHYLTASCKTFLRMHSGSIVSAITPTHSWLTQIHDIRQYESPKHSSFNQLFR